MTEPAAIAGTFADLKTVKTRSVVQMIIEVPIEHGEQIIAAFGFPRPGDEVPVAVARLDPEKANTSPAAPKRPRRPFHDLSLSQQAALRCQDERFREFLIEEYDAQWMIMIKDKSFNEMPAAMVRDLCCVKSRAEFDTNPAAAKEWRDLNAEYEQRAGLQADER